MEGGASHGVGLEPTRMTKEALGIGREFLGKTMGSETDYGHLWLVWYSAMGRNEHPFPAPTSSYNGYGKVGGSEPAGRAREQTVMAGWRTWLMNRIG